MKRKFGFVTNSSSTSFCAWGVKFEYDDDEFNKAVYSYLKEKNNLTISFEEYMDKEDPWDDFVCGIVDEIDLIYADGYLGVSPASMKDKQTLLEFKSEIVNKINKFTIDNKIEDVEFFNIVVYN